MRARRREAGAVNRSHSFGYNLIGAAGANVNFSVNFRHIGDQTNVGPGSWLSPLADNGGPTLTHALLPGSPAINTGTCISVLDNSNVTDDQRGVTRPAGHRCDIGAYELSLPGSPRPPSSSYRFVGFTAPVQNPQALNVAKAGQTIPLKWRLLDGSGNPVTTLSGVTVQVSHYECGLSATPDQAEEHAAGKSGLRNLGHGYYKFNWQTPRSYANSCKTMTHTLDGGIGLAPQALFQFTR